MTQRKVVLISAVVGLIMPCVVLTLLSLFGVWRIVRVGNTDLTHILWPFSAMWRTPAEVPDQGRKCPEPLRANLGHELR